LEITMRPRPRPTLFPYTTLFRSRQGRTPEEAQDLTQDFFALLLERKDLDAVRQEKGRLRSYLLAALKNFLAKAHRRTMAVKRGRSEEHTSELQSQSNLVCRLLLE